jgi:sensor histidine kinase YesM
VQYKNDEIVSAKGEGHGYGLRNIRRSVDKYNGFMEIGHENGLFSVVLFLYCK